MGSAVVLGWALWVLWLWVWQHPLPVHEYLQSPIAGLAPLTIHWLQAHLALVGAAWGSPIASDLKGPPAEAVNVFVTFLP